MSSTGQKPPIPAQFEHLVDDAAIFPPGNAALPEAVAAHRHHARASYSDFLGPFVISDVKLPELLTLLGDRTGEHEDPLPVSVVVTGGAGALEPAVRWAGADALDLRSVEIALRDEADLAHNARRLVTAVDQLVAEGHLGEEARVYVEPPRLYGEPAGHSWLAALDEVAALDLRLKFRTGGVEADAFPGAPELAGCIAAALDRELPFKCTAGLHNAVRHRDEETGFEHHGFLNVLLATRQSLDGADTDEVSAVLDETDRANLLTRLEESGPEAIVSARRWFTSFGSCSVLEPLEDLIDLGLLPALPLEPA